MKQNWKRFMTALLLSLAFALLVPGIMPQQTATVSAKTTAKAKEKNKKSKISLNKQSKKLHRYGGGENDKFVLRVKGTKEKVKWKISDPNVLKLKKKNNYAVTVTSRRSGNATITAVVGKKKLKCKVTVIDLVEEEEKKKAVFENKKAQIYQATGVNAAMKDQYKCFLLAKWICDNIMYAKGSCGGQIYQEALLEGTAVCGGVADLYKYLLDGQNIPCEFISGSTSLGRHGWNQVQIDGEWYNVDVTFIGVRPLDERVMRQAGGLPPTYDMAYFLYSDNAWKDVREPDRYSHHHNATSTRFQGCFTASYEACYHNPYEGGTSAWCYDYNPWFTGEWVNY